jgi:hypothetical protein
MRQNLEGRRRIRIGDPEMASGHLNLRLLNELHPGFVAQPGHRTIARISQRGERANSG